MPCNDCVYLDFCHALGITVSDVDCEDFEPRSDLG